MRSARCCTCSRRSAPARCTRQALISSMCPIQRMLSCSNPHLEQPHILAFLLQSAAQAQALEQRQADVEAREESARQGRRSLEDQQSRCNQSSGLVTYGLACLLTAQQCIVHVLVSDGVAPAQGICRCGCSQSGAAAAGGPHCPQGDRAHQPGAEHQG